MSSTLRKLALAGVAMGVIGATAAEAAPMRATAPAAIGFGQGSGGVSADTVQYRRRYYGGRYYGRRGYGAGPAIAAGAALGLLGAGIAAAAAPSYGYGYGGYPAYGYGGYPAYGYGGYPAYGYGYGW